jgi:hypothetical protein
MRFVMLFRVIYENARDFRFWRRKGRWKWFGFPMTDEKYVFEVRDFEQYYELVTLY